MNPADWKKLKSIFQTALDLEPIARPAFLNEVCANDPLLRSNVERLFTSHDEGGSFLESPAIVDVGVIEKSDSDTEQLVGKRVGPYEIIRELGHGGMGTVYLAVRADDQFRKQVAIKVVNRGMDTDIILRRFTMELQILANLEHPNIARLLEGGSTSDGLPYFVMEYVEGLPINEYCDFHRFSTTQRLELFREVCSALQYAHQNLVVHRDIKPSNILVSAQGTPKLLDFGIAKLLSPVWADDGANPSASMVRLMTPEYASPEQLRSLRITTASDVYSLGVVLYELLSGHHPYHFSSRNPEEVIRTIVQEEPLKPSLVITQVDESATEEATIEAVGQTREGNVEKLRRRLSGDLDNIVLKALRKEPERRYATVQDFSADIYRHLQGLPVAATPDTFSYRTGKFIQRNKAGVGAAAAILVTLIAATGITMWQARVARAERDKAERRFGEVRKLANAVLFKYHDGIENLPGSTPVRKMLVQDALEYLDHLSSETGSDQTLQRELAAAYRKVGDVQGNPYLANLGETKGALESYRKALMIRQQLFKENPTDAQTKLDLAEAYKNVGDVLWGSGDNQESLSNYQTALKIFRDLSGSDPANMEYHEALSEAYNGIGHVQEQSDDPKGALESYRNMLTQAEGLTAADPANKSFRRDVAVGNIKLADALHDTGDDQASLQCYQKAAALLSELASLDTNNTLAQRDLALAYSRLAYQYGQLKEYGKATEFSRKTIEVQELISVADPQNIQIKSDLAASYANLGDSLRGLKKFNEAVSALRESIQLLQVAVQKVPGQIQLRGNLAISYQTLGEVFAAMGNGPAASASYRQALAIFEVEPIRSAKKKDLADCYEDVGDLRAAKGDVNGAREPYEQSLVIWQELERLGKLNLDEKRKPDDVAQKLARSNGASSKVN